jgi:two-component system sensor histidine kinase KdpD
VAAAFGGRTVLVTADEQGAFERATSEGGPTRLSPAESDIARRVLAEGVALEGAGDDSDLYRTLAAPLTCERGVLGALVMRQPSTAPRLSADARGLLEGFTALIAEALERATLTEKAQRAEVDARTERLRNALLSSVSHDFRTPLAVILGAASHLVAHGDSLDPSSRRELAQTAEQEAQRLNRLVNDLLAMTRLDAGVVRATKEWQPIEEVVGAALARMERTLEGRTVTVSLPAGLPLVPLDAVLVEQVLVNLLDNATKHTPAGVPIEVAARAGREEVVLEVLDRGPGLPRGEEEAVFERFHRGSTAAGQGVGLGLAVCRGMVNVHGGRLWAENRPDGGVAFRFTLPLEGKAPVLPPTEGQPTERP